MTFKEKTQKLVSLESFHNLEIYVKLIEEKNKVMNLTGFKGDKLWEEGIYESIIVLKEAFGEVKGKKILDIGAGAGFPSVPYLIAYPENELTIYEPQKKRTLFLTEVSDILNMNMGVLNVRAEDAPHVEYFDFITARAVASYKIMAEISHKPAKIGAKFAFIKGPRAKEEVHEGRWMSKDLDINPKLLTVLVNDKESTIIIYIKEKETPNGFPRKWIDIIKK